MTRGGPFNNGIPYGIVITEVATNPQSRSDFEDFGKAIRFRQLVGFVHLSEFDLNVTMNNFSTTVDSCNIPYGLVTQNSNSYAFQAVPQTTLLPRPWPMAYAPGARATLQVPCH